MTKLGIVYFSATGATETLAQAIEQGALATEAVEVLRFRIDKNQLVEGRFVDQEVLTQLGSCDAIIFGSPTYMGGVASQFKAFADATSELWCEQLWANKLAAGFTCGSAPNGDQSGTLHYFFTLACQQGMLWVSIDAAHGYTKQNVNRLGSQLGVVAHVNDQGVHKVDKATAQYLGQRVAVLAKKLNLNENVIDNNTVDRALCGFSADVNN
ncbi:flavodoxin family protein [Bowmanella yangjiangensis]|uniref:NAD(P)H-dependent oxidoreductase n=1 Tax=Bowmanella yangjiangensis TaxID=2811230 RepID=A0ABS3CRK1_9ALTE|nr:NAD(P)H-dependent oxidoreductase [Bowmanella yangjiangensis]MBN7819739.1 NAD(P)H-dependent oxidoreductase [Bowmanella yangjiangensis]